MTERAPVEGWYPNPEGGPHRRYWDGVRWTDRYAYPTGEIRASADPVRDLEQLRSSARRAKAAVAVGAVLYSVGPALQGQGIRETRRAREEAHEQFESQLRVAPGFQYPPQTTSSFDTASTLLALPALVIGIVFLTWFQRAASVGDRLNRPAQRSPGWAVGGWLIPIGNFWLPYQSARDLFREREPGRRVVKRWWGAYLGAGFASQALARLVGLDDRGAVTIAACALALVLWMLAATFALELIDDATSALSTELTSPAPVATRPFAARRSR